MDIEAERHVDAFVARGFSLAMLKDIHVDSDGDSAIDKFEFLSYMLVTMGKVSQEDIDKVIGIFDALDEDGSGQLDAQDIAKGNARRRAAASAPSAASVLPAPIAPSAEEAPSRASRILGALKPAEDLLEKFRKPLLG